MASLQEIWIGQEAMRLRRYHPALWRQHAGEPVRYVEPPPGPKPKYEPKFGPAPAGFVPVIDISREMKTPHMTTRRILQTLGIVSIMANNGVGRPAAMVSPEDAARLREHIAKAGRRERPVLVNGVWYPSSRAGADAMRITGSFLRKLLRTGRGQWRGQTVCYAPAAAAAQEAA